MQTYLHKDIGEEIKAISGYFTYLEEERLAFRGREVLYAVGVGVVDNSCCGVGGCLFIEVPGYVVSWKNDVDREGRWISCIDPIEKDDEKEGIRRALQEFHPRAQVNFS
jgi:hypothetical protein